MRSRTSDKPDAGVDRRAVTPALAEDVAAPARAAPSERMSATKVAALQRSAGNAAVSGIVRPALPVQRHALGTELPQKEQQTEEVKQAEQAKPQAPQRTRTSTQEKEQTKAASAAGKEFQAAQKLTPGAMSLAGAQSILQGAYGDVKDIVPGTIVVLKDQPACAAKYDEVCIAAGIINPATGVLWKAGDCAAGDAAAGVQTEGFAWQGVVYVNGATTLVTATAHEILHNNAKDTFRGAVGETFNEGMTEFLARKALKASGVKVPATTAYPDQVKLTEKLIDLMGEKTCTDAYFNGADDLIKKFEDLKGKDSWAALKALAEALDMDGTTKALKTSFKSWWRRK